MHYGIAPLFLATVTMAQSTLPGPSGLGAVKDGMGKLGIHEKPDQPQLAMETRLPPEMLPEIFKHLGPVDLLPTLASNRQFYATVVMMLKSEAKVIDAQYLEDPTVSEANKQQYRSFELTNPLATRKHYNWYFWHHLQFRWDHGLLPSTAVLSSSQKHLTAGVVLGNLRDDIITLCKLYLQHAPTVIPGNDGAVATPLALIPYPDLFTVLPVEPRPDYLEQLKALSSRFSYNRFQPFENVGDGILGAFNRKYVMEVPALVERYLNVINQNDLIPLLEKYEAGSAYRILTQDVALNDPVRARYFLNDIMAFQVIPKLIMAYVSKRYYKEALAFIDLMQSNPYLSEFWNRNGGSTGLNYYERAAFMVLRYKLDENAEEFVHQLQATPNFRVNRLYQ
ncbi:hypothetical protein H4R34_005170, partial [Dimargaris verticillata]